MSAYDARAMRPVSLRRWCQVRVAVRAITEDDIAKAMIEEDQERELRAAKRGSRRAGIGQTPRCGACHRFIGYGVNICPSCGYDQHRGWVD